MNIWVMNGIITSPHCMLSHVRPRSSTQEMCQRITACRDKPRQTRIKRTMFAQSSQHYAVWRHQTDLKDASLKFAQFVNSSSLVNEKAAWMPSTFFPMKSRYSCVKKSTILSMSSMLTDFQLMHISGPVLYIFNFEWTDDFEHFIWHD